MAVIMIMVMTAMVTVTMAMVVVTFLLFLLLLLLLAMVVVAVAVTVVALQLLSEHEILVSLRFTTLHSVRIDQNGWRSNGRKVEFGDFGFDGGERVITFALVSHVKDLLFAWLVCSLLVVLSRSKNGNWA